MSSDKPERFLIVSGGCTVSLCGAVTNAEPGGWLSQPPAPTARYVGPNSDALTTSRHLLVLTLLIGVVHRSLAAGFVLGRKLYVVGGCHEGQGELALLEAFDTNTSSWELLPDMPTPRKLLAAGTIDGALYAVGGSNGAARLKTLERYDL